jgi:hypothetical protein
VVGHGDWESQNIRWRGRRPWVVHDWDSTVAQPEAAIAGQAAAVWPAAGGPGEAASIDQTEQFLSAYEQARSQPWTPAEREARWAAGCGSAPSTPGRTPSSAAGRSSTGSATRSHNEHATPASSPRGSEAAGRMVRFARLI